MPLSMENKTGRGCDWVIGPGSLNDYETLKPSSLPLLIPVVTRIIMQLAFVILHNSPLFPEAKFLLWEVPPYIQWWLENYKQIDSRVFSPDVLHVCFVGHQNLISLNQSWVICENVVGVGGYMHPCTWVCPEVYIRHLPQLLSTSLFSDRVSL